MNYQDYSQSSFSLVIDDIMLKHKESCIKFPDCFCAYEVKTASDVWSYVISEDKRKFFMLNYVNQLINQYIEEKQRGKTKETSLTEEVVELKFMYINFLLNESKSKVLALYQIYLLIQEERWLSLRQKMYLWYLHSRIEAHFEVMGQKSDKHLLSFLLMEEKIKLLQDLYENCMLDKLELLNQLNNDHIELSKFQESGIQLLNNKNKLERLKRELSRKWKSSYLVKEILPLVQNSLGFTLNMEQVTHLPDGYVQNQYSHQNSSSRAAAVVSFSNNDLGHVIKATKSFGKLFDLEQSTGTSIHSLIPVDYHKDHSKLIYDYLLNFASQSSQSKSSTEEDNNRQSSKSQKVNFAIAQSKKGFCIPITIRFSVEYIHQFNQIAIFATFEQIQSSSYFIVYDKNTLNIRMVSQNFYSQYLSQLLDSSSINKFEVTSFIPYLKTLSSDNQNQLIDTYNQKKNQKNKQAQNSTISTIGVLPSREQSGQSQKFKFSNLVEEVSKSFLDSNYYQLFQLQFQFNHLQHFQNSNLVILELLSIQKTTSELEFQSSFNQLKTILQPKSSHMTARDLLLSTTHRSTTPQNFMTTFNNIMFSPKQKQMHIEQYDNNPIQDQSTDQYIDIVEESPTNHRHTNRSNIEMSIDSLAVLKLLSQNPSSLSPRILRNTMTTMSTLQDHLQNFGHSNKSQLDSILHLLFPKSSKEGDDAYQKELKNREAQLQQSGEQLYSKGNEQNFPLIRMQPNESLINFGGNIEVIKFQDLDYYQQSIQIDNNLIEENTSNYNNNNTFIRKRTYSNKSHFNGIYKQDNINGNSSGVIAVHNVTNRTNQFNQKNKEEIEKSSQTSGNTGTHIQIKTIRTKLGNKKLNASLWGLNIFGLLCLLLIVSMSIYQFTEMVNGLISIQFDLHFVDWPASVSVVCNGIWWQINLFLIQHSKAFPVLSNQWPTYEMDITNRVKEYTDYGQYIYYDQIISNYNIGWYFNDITYRRNSFYMGEYALPSMKMLELPHFGDSELVFMQKYMASMYFYFLQVFGEQEEQLIITRNYDLMQTNLEWLSVQISNSSIQVDVYTVMIITISLTFFQVILTLPIYLYIQNERENILKLFSTLQRQSIDRMKSQCIESIQAITKVDIKKYLTQKSNTISNSKSSQPQILNKKRSSISSIKAVNFSKKTYILQTLDLNFKKKLISTTSRLPKFHFMLPLYGFSIFVIIIIQPILNAILVESFRTECITIFSGLDSIFSLKDLLTQAMAFSFGDIYSKLTLGKENHLFNPNFFDLKMQSILDKGAQQLNKLNNIANTVQDQESSSKPYLYIVGSLMQNNICDIIQKYPNDYNIENQIIFDYNKCLQSRKGVLQSGLQVASQYFFNQITDLKEIIDIQDPYTRERKFVIWESTFDVLDFNNFYDQLSFVIAFMQKILIDNGYSKINEMWVIQIILVVVQIVILLFIFQLGWIKFFKIISHQLLLNKQIITLFEPDCIIDNPYFMSYINHLK